MLSVLLGLSMSLHLMAYQATEQGFTQTLAPVTLEGSKPVRVVWKWSTIDKA